MSRSRTRDGRRETRATATDRLVAKLATQRGTPMSGGDVARMSAEERRRLLMRLGFLAGRASSEELRAALEQQEAPQRRQATEREPAKRGPGRPSRTGAASEDRIVVRVSKAERAQVERMAEDAGLSVAEFTRFCWGLGWSQK